MPIYKETNKVGEIHYNDISFLPEEYQEVEYIESSGTEYIDTGLKGTNNTRVVLDFQLTNLTQPKRFFGIRDSRKTLYIAYETNYFFFWENGNISSTINIDLLRHKIDFNKNSAYFDENLIKTFTDATFTTDYNLALFSAYYNGNYDNGTSCKMYSAIIYEDGNLVRNFIPCYRKSDSEVGMYDIVNGVFYTNQGTGEFTIGTEVNHSIVRAYRGEDVVFYGLPSGYQKLEYLQSDGNQYIDSGYVPNNNSQIQYIFMPLRATTATFMFGCWGNTTTTGRMCIYVNQTKLQYGFGNGAGVAGVNYKDFVDDVELNTKYDLVMNNTSCYANGVLEVSELSGTNEGNTQTFWIGKCNDPNNRTTNPTKIYECSIWENGVLLKRFVPCYRESDSERGFYDVVNGVFYTNQGVGSFTPPLPEGYQSVNYIEATGTQWIDTGIQASNELGVEFTAEQRTSADRFIFAHMGYLRIGSNNYRLYMAWTGTSFTPDGDRPNIQNVVFNVSVNFHNSRHSYYNGSLYDQLGPITTITGTSPYGIAIFGRMTNSGTVDYLTSGRVYAMRITEGANIVRDFVPCYRESDNEAGLYDLVNGVFYTNDGTGSFVTG